MVDSREMGADRPAADGHALAVSAVRMLGGAMLVSSPLLGMDGPSRLLSDGWLAPAVQALWRGFGVVFTLEESGLVHDGMRFVARAPRFWGDRRELGFVHCRTRRGSALPMWWDSDSPEFIVSRLREMCAGGMVLLDVEPGFWDARVLARVPPFSSGRELEMKLMLKGVEP